MENLNSIGKVSTEERLPTKEELYQRLGVQSPDAIFVTSGSIVPRTDKEGNFVRYSATSFQESDVRGFPMWGKARVITAVEMGEDFPNATIVGLSDADKLPRSAGDVAREQIAGKLSPDHKIESYTVSWDTFSEMMCAVKLAIERGWHEAVILVGAGQKSRADAMLYSILHTELENERAQIEQMLAFTESDRGRFKDPLEHAKRQDDINTVKEAYEMIKTHKEELEQVRIITVPAEPILKIRGEKHKAIVEEAEANPKYQEQILKDADGAEQWRRGEYGMIPKQ